MPIAPQNRSDLAKVAQYLSVRTAPRQAQTEVGLYLGSELRRKFAAELPKPLRQSQDVDQLIRIVGEQHRLRAADKDPDTILASFPLPTSAPSSVTCLLED